MDIVQIAEAGGLDPRPQSGGTKFAAYCPFCDRRDKRKLWLYPHNQTFFCFRCRESGTAVWLYARLYEVSLAEARRQLGVEASEKPLRRQLYCSGIDAGNLELEEPAPLSLRDRAYRAFLERLPLYSRHRESLLERGLTEAAIEANGYRSVPGQKRAREICAEMVASGIRLQNVPGFYRDEEGWTCVTMPGIFIPYRTPEGAVQGLQVRVDDKVLQGGGPKYPWFSSAGKQGGAPANAKATVHWALPGSRRVPLEVCVTEGALKADIAALWTRRPFVAVPGVAMWRGVVDALKVEGVKRAIICFDADWKENAAVERDRANLIAKCRQEAIVPVAADWDIRRGKGIDDLVVGAGVETETFPLPMAQLQKHGLISLESGIEITLRRQEEIVIKAATPEQAAEACQRLALLGRLM